MREWERESSRDLQKNKHEDREYNRDKEKNRKRDSSYYDQHKQKKKHKKHNDRSRSHEKKKKNKDKERERSRQKPKNKDYADLDDVIKETENRRSEKKKKRKHSRSRSEEKRRERKSEKKSRSIEGQKQSSEKETHKKDKYRQKIRDDREESQERSNSRKKKYRDRSRQKVNKYHRDKDEEFDRYRNRSRDRNRKRRDDYRSDYRNDYRNDYRRDDRRRRDFKQKESFRFDSPPKSDESDIEDDPEKMEKLAQLKAEKELVSSKADRKLYLGNLPPNITSQQLMDMLNAALKKMEINTEAEGDSIVSAWISPDGVGHYAFVEFRSAQEATNGLALNGASLFGYQLKLGRPKQYIEYNKALLSEMGTDRNMETIIKKVATFGKIELDPVEERIVCPPSKIVILKHIVSIQELGIDEEYEEILDDVTDMAKRFGEVIKIHIPRPHQIIDLQHAPQRVKGLGLIFIEYKTIDDARNARKKFAMKQFSGHPVACSFFDEGRYKQGELDLQQKIIIDF